MAFRCIHSRMCKHILVYCAHKLLVRLFWSSRSHVAHANFFQDRATHALKARSDAARSGLGGVHSHTARLTSAQRGSASAPGQHASEHDTRRLPRTHEPPAAASEPPQSSGTTAPAGRSTGSRSSLQRAPTRRGRLGSRRQEHRADAASTVPETAGEGTDCDVPTAAVTCR